MSHDIAIRGAPQRFILSRELINSVSAEEVLATYDDMEEMGLAKPPYPFFDVFYGGWVVLNDEEGIRRTRSVLRLSERGHTLIYDDDNVPWEDKPCKLVLRYIDGKPDNDLLLWSPLSKKIFSTQKILKASGYKGTITNSQRDDYYEALHRFYKLLLVLLATKNVEKTTETNKLGKLGIGKDKGLKYTTTLRLGAITESVGKSTGSGVARRPHMRRGHIRRQRFGPKNELVKKIFIDPVFVNADEGWIAERTAYNVRL